MINAGEKIYLLRKEKGVSQEELAFSLNVSRQTVSRWETDSVNPTKENYKSLCLYFGVEEKYFSDNDEVSATEDKIEAVSKQENKVVAISRNKILVLIAVSVLLIICIVTCIVVGYAVLVPNDNEGLNIRIVNRFRYVGIVFIILAVILLLILITIWVIVIKNRIKSKM